MWWERLLLHEYNECYLYHSLMKAEYDRKGEGDLGAAPEHGARTTAHRRGAAARARWRDPAELLPPELPEPLMFEPEQGLPAHPAGHPRSTSPRWVPATSTMRTNGSNRCRRRSWAAR